MVHHTIQRVGACNHTSVTGYKTSIPRHEVLFSWSERFWDYVIVGFGFSAEAGCVLGSGVRQWLSSSQEYLYCQFVVGLITHSSSSQSYILQHCPQGPVLRWSKTVLDGLGVKRKYPLATRIIAIKGIPPFHVRHRDPLSILGSFGGAIQRGIGGHNLMGEKTPNHVQVVEKISVNR